MYSNGSLREPASRAAISRRRILSKVALGGAGLAGFALVGCSSSSTNNKTNAAGTISAATKAASSATAVGSKVAGSPAAVGNFDDNAKVVAGFTFVHDSMDPHSVTLPPYGIPFRGIYDAMTFLGGDGKLSPRLAASWESADPSTWIFHLRDDVKFHNGEQFDSESVRFTMQKVVDAKQTAGQPFVKAKVETPDAKTLKVSGLDPDALFPTAMANLFIIPAKYYASAGGLDGFVKAPIGTGPFKLTEFRPGDLVRMSRVDGNWHPKPHVSEVAFRVIPDNATRSAALKTGEIIIGDSLPPESLAEFKDSKTIDISSGLRPNLLTVDLGGAECKDKRVRLAINEAVDRQGIVEKLFGGKGAVVGQTIGPNAVGYDPNIKPVPYDVADAVKLLAAAGLSGGFSTTMTHSTALSGEPLAAQAVVGFLDKVGIKITLKSIEPTVRLDNFIKGSPEPFFTWGGGYANLMDAAACLTYYRSAPGVSVRYQNPAFDSLYTSMRQDVNTQSRVAKISQLNAMLREDLPVLWEFVPAGFTGVSKKIAGFENRGDGNIDFDTMQVRA